MGSHHANVSATDLVDLPHQQLPSSQQPSETQRLPADAPTDSDAERQTAASGQQDEEEERNQCDLQPSLRHLDHKKAAKEGVDAIEAEGRPPTVANTGEPESPKAEVSAGTIT